MNKAVLRAKISALFAAFILIVSFYAYVMLCGGSVAWFSTRKTVEANGVKVNVDAPEGIQTEITVHDIQSKSEDGTVLNFYRTSAADSLMPTYDILDDVNRYLLVKIKFRDLAGHDTINVDFNASMKKGYGYFMDSDRPLLSSDDGKGTTYDNCLSSIVNFAIVTPNANNTSAYSIPMPAAENKARLFNVVNDEYVFGDLSFMSEDTVETGDEIYLLISYDEEMITRVYSENIGNDNLGSTVGGIKYIMDFEFNLTLRG